MLLWKRYGLQRRLRRGDSLLLFLTFRCTLHCDYCALKYIDGKYPKSSEITLSDWKRIVKSFPRKIREVKITGGEPMIMPYFTELVNWLVDEGYFVLIITNLTVMKLFRLSDKILISATEHKSTNHDKWRLNYEFYKNRHRVKHGVIGDTKELCFREYGDTCTGFMYSPEGRLFTHVNEMYEEYTK